MLTSILSASQLRAAWLEFWRSRSHTVVKSAELIPTHPTAPMFTNSGMMQFVPYFLGEEQVPFVPPRATSIQKCVRAGGKHNDLDAIGISLRHLSFFEMLGNFSFGDYFKREAIVWAWEFVTEVLKIDYERVWVTIHLTDDEAAEIWHKVVGVPLERIQRLDKDNFWEMGETGPCGPSSELFYDFGPEYGPDGGPQNPESESRFIEFWNLVFMQFFRDSSGVLTPLPQKHVDTGAGLERIVGILRGSPSLFSCDTLSPLVDQVARISRRKLNENKKDDVAMRIIADHARSATFLLSDGVIPSNENRGYVLRRIIRRASRFAYLLGIESNIMSQMAEQVIGLHKDVYPELDAMRNNILKAIGREEDKFRENLALGLSILELELNSLREGDTLSGRIAFILYDTHGFPFEITSEIAAEKGREVDVSEFHRLMHEQRQRGRASTKSNAIDTKASDYQRILESCGSTEFIGRTSYNVHARVIDIISARDGAEIFLDRTPFYAEQGGQVGDQGTLKVPGLGLTFRVIDTTQPVLGLYSHHVINDEKVKDLCIGDKVEAQIDVSRREQICRNHTATHLIHWALREVLGKHVTQQGSLVEANRLRFDFGHFESLSGSQIREVEDLVNREVLSDATVEQFETTKEEAIANGAIALFGEKYGDRVRVLRAGSHSLEFCGGTHVNRLGQIGLVKIVSEGSIGSNLRRLEAVTGTGVLELIRKQNSDMKALADRTGIPLTQLFDGLHRRLTELRTLRSENEILIARLEKMIVDSLVSQVQGRFLIKELNEMEGDALRRLAINILNRTEIAAVVIGSVNSSGRPIVVAAVADSLSVSASTMLDQVSKLIGGGHGKQPKVAVASGIHASKLEEALEDVRESLYALDQNATEP